MSLPGKVESAKRIILCLLGAYVLLTGSCRVTSQHELFERRNGVRKQADGADRADSAEHGASHARRLQRRDSSSIATPRQLTAPNNYADDLDAEELLEELLQQNNTANAQRLAVIVLLTDLHESNRDRVSMLHASMRLAAKHLFPTTPCNVYIFTEPQHIQLLEGALKDLRNRPDLAPLHVLPVHSAPWSLPEAGLDRSFWQGTWKHGYRMMGDWRLEAMPKFARSLGHRYVLVLDDDSYIRGPPPYNLVRQMQEGKYLMAVRRLTTEPPIITWGLPELTKYFLLAYRVKPTTLYEHCKPPNLDGLYSSTGPDPPASLDPEANGVPAKGGWDREVINGNFVIIDLDFWFQPLVQRFVQLCRHSGGTFMYRWNEQAVVGMANRVFVPAAQLLLLDFPYAHKKGTPQEQLLAGGIVDVDQGQPVPHAHHRRKRHQRRSRRR